MEETLAFPERQSNSTSIRRTVSIHHIWTGFEDEVRYYIMHIIIHHVEGGGGEDTYEKREIF